MITRTFIIVVLSHSISFIFDLPLLDARGTLLGSGCKANPSHRDITHFHTCDRLGVFEDRTEDDERNHEGGGHSVFLFTF